MPHIIRTTKNEQININQSELAFPFQIGKLRESLKFKFHHCRTHFWAVLIFFQYRPDQQYQPHDFYQLFFELILGHQILFFTYIYLSIFNTRASTVQTYLFALSCLIQIINYRKYFFIWKNFTRNQTLAKLKIVVQSSNWKHLNRLLVTLTNHKREKDQKSRKNEHFDLW